MARQQYVGGFSFILAATSLWTAGALAQADASAAPASPPAAITPSEFERGLGALQAGQNQVAVDAFSKAYAADGNPIALMNLGIAYTNLGLLNHAFESLTRFVEKADPARDAANISAVQNEIERLRATNGVVVLNLTPADASIQIDGQMVSPLAGELLVAPGPRHFVVFADGFVSYDQNLQVAAGRFALDVKLTPLSEVALQPTAASAKPATPAPSDAETTDEPEPEAGLDCALSNVCFGPVLSLIGPPNLFGGGLHVRLGEYFGAGVDYQMTPSITFDPVSLSASLFSVHARVYPFGGAFFLGGGFGYQSVTGKIDNADVTVSANAGFPAAMASIGFMGSDGFVIGMDLGVLFPLGSSDVTLGEMTVHREFNGMSVPQEMVDQARDEVQSQVRKVVDALPVSFQLNLLRIGYLF